MAPGRQGVSPSLKVGQGGSHRQDRERSVIPEKKRAAIHVRAPRCKMPPSLEWKGLVVRKRNERARKKQPVLRSENRSSPGAEPRRRTPAPTPRCK
ncbi:hypothetical protein NDU88_005766 [Pleurodeles waltl]|uniref:Uncharacterized protein n=1 Tax=Pleurodeles waltl TaxID=8319 RepID=A0AAV7SMM7_PLEWA|nr:hypothetical protein NDU88_005766 [Pleurodeles waltl]